MGYIRHEGIPTSYTGFFFDPYHHVSLYVYGERIENPDDIAKLRTRPGRQEVAVKFLKECDEQYFEYKLAQLDGGLATHKPEDMKEQPGEIIGEESKDMQREAK